MKTLGSRLKDAREKKHLTQIQAADKLGISNGTLSGYERNYRDPDTTILKKMSDLYGTGVDQLLGKVSAYEQLPSEIKTEVDERLEDILKGLTPTQKEHLASFIDVLQNERD